jgi:hypothetical protein
VVSSRYCHGRSIHRHGAGAIGDNPRAFARTETKRSYAGAKDRFARVLVEERVPDVGVVLRLILHHGFAAKLHQPFAAKVHQASRDG